MPYSRYLGLVLVTSGRGPERYGRGNEEGCGHGVEQEKRTAKDSEQESGAQRGRSDQRDRPPRVGDPKVIKLIARRKVSVTGGWKRGLAGGQRFYLCRRDDEDGRLRPIEDVDTGRPLMVQIAGTRKTTSTAWLMGEPPRETDLRGVVLRPALPPPVELPADDEDDEVAAVVTARRAIPDR